MSGPDRRAPGETGSTPVGPDGQTDPFIPKVTDPAPRPVDQTDPYLHQVGVPPPMADRPSAADHETSPEGRGTVPVQPVAASGSGGRAEEDDTGAVFGDTDVHAVITDAGTDTRPAVPAAPTGTPTAASAGDPDVFEAVTGPHAVVGQEASSRPADDPAGDGAHRIGTDQNEPYPDDMDPAAQPGTAWWRRARVLIPLGLLSSLLLLYAVDILVAGNDVPRNTVVAGLPLGGLTTAEAARVLTERGVPAMAAPRSATAGTVTLDVRPAEAGVTLDVPGTVEAASAQPLNPITRVWSLFGDRRVDAVLDVDQPALDEAMTGFAEQVDVTFVEGSIEIEGTTPTVVHPSDGRELDRAEAADVLQAALRTGSRQLVFPVLERRAQVTAAEAGQTLESFAVPALSAPVLLTGGEETTTDLTVEEIAAALRFGPGDDGSLLPWVDEASLLEGFGADAGQFASPPVDATFDVSGASVSVIPSMEGTAIDAASLAQDLMRVLRLPAPRESAVPLMVARPGLSTDEARALNIVDPVSTFTSAYDDAGVAQNIRIVAETVDGAVIRPGQTYSLNTATGARTAEQGYVEAAAPGEAEAAVGEGISPLATAMFNAVFFAGLEPVRHTAHSSYNASYPAGRDATVRYDDTDLTWRNDSANGIYIQTNWTSTAVTVTFWSAVTLQIEAVSGSQSNLRQPASETRSGAGCQTSSGSAGFEISMTRVFMQAGTGRMLREEEFTTSYDPTPRVLCVGAPVPPPVADPPPPEPPVVIDPEPTLSTQPSSSTPTTTAATTTPRPPPTTTAPTPTTTTTTAPTTTTSTTITTTTTAPPTTTSTTASTSAAPTGAPTSTPAAASAAATPAAGSSRPARMLTL